MEYNVKIKKTNSLDNQALEQLSKEELISRIRSLEAHNCQLQNIIAKSNCSGLKQPSSKPFDFSTCRFRHILLRFFYLGWGYQGFAIQEDSANTIEYHIFTALTKTCLIKDRSSSNYNRCGRTDKGVSAFGQTISIDVRSKLTEENENDLDKEIDYCKILNRVLPENIKCVAWAPISNTFSARFDCLSRTYKYYFPKGNLDIEKMREASKYLIGTHDFRNFCKMDVGNGVVQFIRNLLDFRIEPLNQQNINNNNDYNIWVAIIKGNAFLWHQIRFIMGILFLIGSNKEEPLIIKELLNVQENPRKPDYNMASEIPLNLFECEYENVTWHYNKDNIISVLNDLRQIWTYETIKVVMVRDIIKNLLENIDSKSTLNCLSKFLLGGVKSKKYVPVMKRQTCESLENRIETYAKRKRIEVIPNNDESVNSK